MSPAAHQRSKIAIVFSYNASWIGGTYYVLNLIRSLETVEDASAPLVFLVHDKTEHFEFVRSQTSYPYLRPLLVRGAPRLLVLVNRAFKKFFGRELAPWRMKDQGFQLLFPAPMDPYYENIRSRVFWIPDFQQRHYPEFFSQAELIDRADSIAQIVATNLPLVLSSSSAHDDLRKIHPEAKNPVTILRFAVTLPPLDLTRLPEVQQKYSIAQPYFFCANQFWAHKNHRCLFEALVLLRPTGYRPLVICSGKQMDTRNASFFPILERFVEENHLGDQVRFVGFIDREEQLLLMKGSKAVVQTSLFEGWSTVVEDAKALSIPIILSDLLVHREQNPPRARYFDPLDPASLANAMMRTDDLSIQDQLPSYSESIRAFSQAFLKLFQKERPFGEPQ